VARERGERALPLLTVEVNDEAGHSANDPVDAVYPVADQMAYYDQISPFHCGNDIVGASKSVHHLNT